VFGGEERSGPRGEHQEGSKSISSRPSKQPMISKFWWWPQVPHTRPLCVGSRILTMNLPHRRLRTPMNTVFLLLRCCSSISSKAEEA
jgi:hypothetical protein